MASSCCCCSSAAGVAPPAQQAGARSSERCRHRLAPCEGGRPCFLTYGIAVPLPQFLPHHCNHTHQRTYQPPLIMKLHTLCARVTVAVVRGQQLVAAGPLAQAAPPTRQPGAQARQCPRLLIRVLVSLHRQGQAVAGGARQEGDQQRAEQDAGELGATAAAGRRCLPRGGPHQVRPAKQCKTREEGAWAREGQQGAPAVLVSTKTRQWGLRPAASPPPIGIPGACRRGWAAGGRRGAADLY